MEDLDWVSLIKDDFLWLLQQLHNSTSLPDPKTHFPVWKDILLQHGEYWKKLSKKGVAHACLQREMKTLQYSRVAGLQVYYTNMDGSLVFRRQRVCLCNNRLHLAVCSASRLKPPEQVKVLIL